MEGIRRREQPLFLSAVVSVIPLGDHTAWGYSGDKSAGNIDVAQATSDVVVITMTGVAVAGAHPFTDSTASMHFDLTQNFEISFDNPKLKRAKLVLEGRVPKATVEELKKRGHEVEVGDQWSEGRLTAASREDPWRKAAANPRGMQGYAAGR